MTADMAITVGTLLRSVERQSGIYQDQVMPEPLDLGKIYKDIRRTAALLGQPANPATIYSGRGYNSRLPLNYWGKPTKVPQETIPNVSFIRSLLNDEKFSLPSITNPTKAQKRKDDINSLHKPEVRAKESKSKGSDNTDLTLPSISSNTAEHAVESYGYAKRDALVGKLKRDKKFQDVRGSGKDTPMEGADHYDTERTQEQTQENELNGNINKTFQERLTIHIPDQDRANGYATLQKLSSDADVLPPLVSIHSGASTTRSRYSRNNNHFKYQHLGTNEAPNFPHSKTDRSVLRDSSTFHIKSLGRNSDTPDDLFPGIQTDSYLLLLNSQSPLPKTNRGRIKYPANCSLAESDYDAFVSSPSGNGDYSRPIYSDASSSVSPTNSLVINENYCDISTDTVETAQSLKQMSYKESSSNDFSNLPKPVNKTYEEGQKPQKRTKAHRKLEKGINVHRHAYLAALSVARSQQIPRQMGNLRSRFSRSFEFSYFQHIPHQRPCRCAECRERMVNNAINPKKSKKKKVNHLKSIFGSVKVEDYYPRNYDHTVV